MMPAANQGVGMNMGFPDVCMTPVGPAPVPIPYPNIGMNAMAMPFIPNVMVSMAPAQNMGAKPMMTNGDNAGVAHPMVMMAGGTIMGNPRILMGGMPASHLMVPTYGNNFNNPVGAKLVPSVTNVLLGDAALLGDDDGQGALQLLTHERATARHTGTCLELCLPHLSFASARWLERALAAAPPFAAIVLDLRGNPGGPVAVANRCAMSLRRHPAPVAVLIDRHTASAAELLALQLRDDQTARLFGERSFGKDVAMRFALPPTAPHDSRRTNGLRADGPAMAMASRGGSRFADGVRPDEPCAPADAADAAAQWLVRPTRRAS